MHFIIDLKKPTSMKLVFVVVSTLSRKH